MKVLVALFAVIVIVVARPENEFYDSRYDDFDVEPMIKNKNLLKSYGLCMVDEGKCTPEGKDFKQWAPEAVQSSCGKCTEKQRVLVAKTMKAIMADLPEIWEKLHQKYDAEGKYDNEFKSFIDKYAA